MDCDALVWYQEHDEALQTRIRMLACFTADLRGMEWQGALPGACRGARDDRAIFEQIVAQLVAPHFSERAQGLVSKPADVATPAGVVAASDLRGRQG